MVNSGRFCTIKKPEDFIALPRSDKSEFFAHMLKPAHIRKLSKTVEETAKTDREMGGHMKMRDGSLSISFAQNQFKINLERYLADLGQLVLEIKDGKQQDEIITQNPQLLFGAENALRFSGNELFAAYEKLNLSYGELWNLFVLFSVDIEHFRSVRDGISEAINSGYTFDRYSYEERFMHFLERILGAQKVRHAYGRNSALLSAPKYLLEFHTHPWLPGFSEEDLELVSKGKVSSIVLARSVRTIGNIDIFLAEPRDYGGVEDLGCIFSFQSAVKQSADELAGSMIDTVKRGVARLKFD